MRRTYSGVSTVPDKCYWHRRRDNKYSCCTLEHVSGLAQWPSMNMLEKKERKKKQSKKERQSDGAHCCQSGAVKVFTRAPGGPDWPDCRSRIHTALQGWVTAKPAAFHLLNSAGLDTVQQRVSVKQGNSCHRLTLRSSLGWSCHCKPGSATTALPVKLKPLVWIIPGEQTFVMTSNTTFQP